MHCNYLPSYPSPVLLGKKYPGWDSYENSENINSYAKKPALSPCDTSEHIMLQHFFTESLKTAENSFQHHKKKEATEEN